VVGATSTGWPGSCARTLTPDAWIVVNIRAVTTNDARRHMDGLLAQPLLFDNPSASIGTRPRRRTMLETIAVILIILWLLGMVSGYTLGNFIYVLLVVAIVLFLVRLISGRRV
jgi:hypothetical protein